MSGMQVRGRARLLITIGVEEAENRSYGSLERGMFVLFISFSANSKPRQPFPMRGCLFLGVEQTFA